MKLLCLSNGHGEDEIAVQILQKLRQISPHLEIFATPLVGRGYAYQKADISIWGKVQQMPSGGFVYMDNRQLWRDIQGGLLSLTLQQYQVIRQWGKIGGKILAVGDIVPLLFAWLSQADYIFLGIAKSEYYLREEKGWLSTTTRLERLWGSVYYPWERYLMANSRCQAVLGRDELTCKVLQQWSIPAVYLGNPMMDSLVSVSSPLAVDKETLFVLLLPGSRLPEAEANWQMILQAVDSVIFQLSEKKIVCLAAIAPSLKISNFTKYLPQFGWQIEQGKKTDKLEGKNYQKGFNKLILSQNNNYQAFMLADIAIALAGTATEQFVGLGKPVFTFPGKGPQFTYRFAEAQTRLLGISVTLVDKPREIGQAVANFLAQPYLAELIAQNGRQRMGLPGAAERIADYIKSRFRFKG